LHHAEALEDEFMSCRDDFSIADGAFVGGQQRLQQLRWFCRTAAQAERCQPMLHEGRSQVPIADARCHAFDLHFDQY
jgi:hypothetical protein